MKQYLIMFQAIFNCNLTYKGINTMKQNKFEFKPEFFNFMYHAILEKLYAETLNSEYLDELGVVDKRVPIVLGDVFEQIFGIDRNDVLKNSYKRLGKYFKVESNPSDPVIAQMLLCAELSQMCGSEELEFDEIYPQQISN